MGRAHGLLPCRFELNPNSGLNNSPREAIFLSPDYRAEGTFETGSCHALPAVWDLTAVRNGAFRPGVDDVSAIEARSLYVLIGRDGVIRYGGSDGEQPTELRAARRKLMPAPAH